MQNDASVPFILNFSPTEKQREFFLSDAKFTAYGGARGGGKSFALRYKLILLCLAYPGIRVLLIRRSYPELRENHIRPLCEILCGKTPIAKYRELEKAFDFFCGSHMLLGYLSSHDDLLRYQGLQFDIIAVDEATQIDEEMFLVLCASLRGANSFPKRMYLTCNPGGIGHGWVKRLFIDRIYRKGENPEDYRFIPASVYDNKALMEQDPDYVKRLEALPEGLRAAWLCGRWDVFSGQFFSEFDERKHVVSPISFPNGTRFYAAMDYGLDMLAALFIAVLPNGRAYVYDEIYESNLIVSRAAEKIYAKLKPDMTVIAPADLWSRSKDSGRSVSDLFADGGVYLTKIVPNRIDGWLALKEWLADMDGEPKLRIFPNCVNILRTLPLLLYDPKNHGDAATEPHEITHAPDALRYFASYCRGGMTEDSSLLRRKNRFGRR
ncbi:MAG: phage terminase large subunit [Clostridia bacterium]|nr:phage terminase large subunit [Clostridia bacterium]